MTEPASRTSTTGLAERVTVRPYRPLDHRACRELWAELVQTKRELYHTPGRPDADQGAGFEEYLTRLDIGGIWVAEHPEEGVVGLVGLVLGSRRGGEVEPVVVAGRLRGRGIGRLLLRHVADEARRRALTELSVSPDARNVEAIHCLHRAGYTVLSSITLTLDLDQREDRWQDGLDVHEVRFRY
jgi:GNAT superfamily N-acetyltransferase